jgi:hypothetical protein
LCLNSDPDEKKRQENNPFHAHPTENSNWLPHISAHQETCAAISKNGEQCSGIGTSATIVEKN